MQGKGFVKLFTWLLLFVVAYQFVLMYPTWRVESDAESYAQESIANTKFNTPEEQTAALDVARHRYLDSISNEQVFSLFFIKSYTYQELKRQQLALGLDLKGGMSVVLQVDLNDLILALASESNDVDLRAALAEAKKMQKNAQTDFVTLFGRAFEAKAPNRKLATIFVVDKRLEGIDINSSNSQVLTAIRAEARQSVQRTYKLLKDRIDRFGVTQPVVSLDETTDRITVELPGVTNPQRARQYLQATANLEFWDVYHGSDLAMAFSQLNEALKAKESGVAPATDTTNAKRDSLGNIIPDTTKPATNPVATTDSMRAKFGPIGVSMQVSNQASAAVGFAHASDTALVNSYLNSPEAARIFPRNARFMWSKKYDTNTETGERFFTLYAIDTKDKKVAPLQGDRIRSTRVESDPKGTGAAVSIEMDKTGTNEWKSMTQRNVGREVAIALDNIVYSAPVVNEVIAGGRTQITGNFTQTDAQDLANILSVGKLPARTEIIEEAIIGPSLGEATVRAGLIALVVGFLAVLVFMLGYYAFAGFISVLALLLNLLFIIACLASFGTVLTLPGIAGIVLTVGMAVDANVIIFERVREETRSGQASFKDALAKGFAQSYSSIIDANLTTLLTALILFIYGLGPIKGFATVLMVGVISSVFTAVLVGRLMFDYFLRNRDSVSIGTAATQNVLANPNTDFMGKRKIAYAASGLLILAGLASIFTRGFELGVDLQGGRSYTVEFPKEISVDELKSKLVAAFDGYDKVIVKTFNQANQAKITTSFMQDSDDPKVDNIVLEKLHKGAQEFAGVQVGLEQFSQGKNSTGLALTASSKVGPTIADDIQDSAFWTGGLALLAIFGYIFIRFRKWQYSVGAIAALAHDVLVTVGMFSLLSGVLPFSLEIDQAFIAAILTVIGYSINDTVIVFDRIRDTVRGEVAQEFKTFGEAVNYSINNTLSRTFMTSFTTLLVVILLFLFGGDGIRGFSFALLIGIGIGTYSSIFIAAPLTADLTKDLDSMRETTEEESFEIKTSGYNPEAEAPVETKQPKA